MDSVLERSSISNLQNIGETDKNANRQTEKTNTYKSDLSLSVEEVDFISTHQVRVFLQMYRNAFHEYPSRVKTIYRPDLVIQSGTHIPLNISPRTRAVVVNSSLAILAHHRQEISEGFLDYRVSPCFRTYLEVLMSSSKEFKSFLSMFSNRTTDSN